MRIPTTENAMFCRICGVIPEGVSSDFGPDPGEGANWPELNHKMALRRNNMTVGTNDAILYARLAWSLIPGWSKATGYSKASNACTRT
jgi:hypothetical protein